MISDYTPDGGSQKGSQADNIIQLLQDLINSSKKVYCQHLNTLQQIDSSLGVDDVLDKNYKKVVSMDVTERSYDVNHQQAIVHHFTGKLWETRYS